MSANWRFGRTYHKKGPAAAVHPRRAVHLTDHRVLAADMAAGGL